jgi:hypothetical protein
LYADISPETEDFLADRILKAAGQGDRKDHCGYTDKSGSHSKPYYEPEK